MMLKIKITTLFTFAVSFVLLLGCNQKPKDDLGNEEQSTSSQETSDQARDRGMSKDFTLTDLEGTSHALSSYKGKVVLLDFWASWCPPCRAEIPHLVNIYNAYKDKGLVIIGVGLDKRANLVKIQRELKIDYTVLVDEKSEVGRLYDVKGIPRTLILDKEGRIAADHVGFAEGMQKDLEQEIKNLLAE